MKISTINSIEVSSLCDRSCRYCPAKDQGKHREVGLMTMEIFLQALDWVRHFAQKGTQLELNLFGVGEPTLNPLLPEMISKARAIMPIRLPVHTNTNGRWVDTSTTLITEAEMDFIRSLKRAGIDHIDVTGHDPFKTAKAVRILQAVGIAGQLSFDFMLAPNNWAGQVEWFRPMYNAGPCPWIGRGQAMIMSNGAITRCCIDAFGTGILGSVQESSPDAIDISPFPLCSGCHHTIKPDNKALGCNEIML